MVDHHCDHEIHGGFSRGACLLWMSFMSPGITYFEWGSGFTTVTSDSIGVKVTSIEGSKSWYDSMKEKHRFKPTTNLTYVDIGYTGGYSWPKDPTRGTPYIYAIQDQPSYDVVLVDGRFRVACALAAHGLSDNVLVHDFSRRHYRRLVGPFGPYIKVSETEELAHLTPNRSVARADIDAMLFSEIAVPNR